MQKHVVAGMTDDDWQSFDPRAWVDYEDDLYDEIEDTIRVIEWQDEAEARNPR